MAESHGQASRPVTSEMPLHVRGEDPKPTGSPTHLGRQELRRLALKPSEPSHQVFNIFYMSLYVFICFYMSLFSWNFRNGLDVCIYIYIRPLGWWSHGISEEVLAAQLGTNLSWQCGNKGSATGFRLHPVRIERHACHSWAMVLTISFASNLKVVASQVQLFPCSATSPGVICPLSRRVVRLRLYWTTLLAHRWRCRALES